MSNKSSRFHPPQDTRHCGLAVTSRGQIPRHLPSCIPSCIIVLGIPALGASGHIQSPHILSLLFWPPSRVCFLVSRKKRFLVVFAPCALLGVAGMDVTLLLWSGFGNAPARMNSDTGVNLGLSHSLGLLGDMHRKLKGVRKGAHT